MPEGHVEAARRPSRRFRCRTGARSPCLRAGRCPRGARPGDGSRDPDRRRADRAATATAAPGGHAAAAAASENTAGHGGPRGPATSGPGRHAREEGPPGRPQRRGRRPQGRAARRPLPRARVVRHLAPHGSLAPSNQAHPRKRPSEVALVCPRFSVGRDERAGGEKFKK